MALPEGGYRALSAVDPRSGCALGWQSADEFDAGSFRSEIQPGSFRDGCHGSTYDVMGRRVFGPGPWDMDIYASAVDEPRERLAVDLDERTRRPSAGYSPPRGDATPTPAAPPSSPR